MNKEIDGHNIIVFGTEHYNPLGAIRSLGEAGVNPIAVIVSSNGERVASSSKYISDLYLVDSVEAGYKLIIGKFGNKKIVFNYL